jgi:acetyltransferase-like isoleucine patch superfamily enzyme
MFKRLTRDRGNWWVAKLDKFLMFGFTKWSAFRVKISSSIRGVQIKRGCKFFGVPRFSRFSFSSIEIGENCTFRSDQSSNLIGVNHRCILSTHEENAKIKIGNHCGFSGTTIGAAKEIIIGNSVLCGANVVITDFDWHLDISKTRPQPVIIHDNVWIGLNTVVLKGVEIGENTIIGANSLVVNNIPANVIAGGNPCKVLKAKESQ